MRGGEDEEGGWCCGEGARKGGEEEKGRIISSKAVHACHCDDLVLENLN